MRLNSRLNLVVLGLLGTTEISPLFAQTQSEWKIYELSPLCAPLSESNDMTIWGPHLSSEDGETPRNRFFFQKESSPFLRPDELISLLRELGSQDAGSAEEVFYDIQDQNLIVRGSASAQKLVENHLALIRDCMRRHEMQIRVELLEAKTGKLPQKVILDPAEIESLRLRFGKDIERVWQVEGLLFTGKTFSTAQRTESAFLPSYNVEVATKSKGVQPISGKAISGPALSVRPYYFEELGKIHLSFLVESSRLKGISLFETKALDFSWVQRPRLEMQVLASSLTLQLGQSALLSVQDLSGEKAYLVSAVPRAKTEKTEETLRFLSTHFLLDWTGRELLSLGPSLQEADTDLMPDNQSTLTPDFLSQLLRTKNDPKLSRDRSALLRSLGGYYFFLDSKSHPALDAYRELQGQYLPSVPLRWEIKDENQTVLARWTLSASMHRVCGAIWGEESRYLSGYRIQIAQESTIAEPIVDPIFHGTVVRCLLQEMEGTRVRCFIDFQSQLQTSEKLMQSGTQSAGHFLQIEESFTPIRGSFELERGKARNLGELKYIDSSGRMTRAQLYLTAF